MQTQTTATPSTPEIELLPLEQSLPIVGDISKNHFYDLIRRGILPKPVKLSRQCSRWIKSELEAAVAKLVAARTNPKITAQKQ